MHKVSTLAGVRGQVGDTLLDLKTPALFVVGERSSQCNTDDIEVIDKPEAKSQSKRPKKGKVDFGLWASH